MSRATPVAATDRLETLDVLRGFALLGILAMNIRAMAGPFEYGVRPQDDGPVFDALRRERAAVRGQVRRVGPGDAGALVPADILAARHRTGARLSHLDIVRHRAPDAFMFQSIITSIVFLGWGVGLAGRLDYAGQLLCVLAIWAIQLAFSPAWLARYRFGPAEWLWRSLTYWKRQPIGRDVNLAVSR